MHMSPGALAFTGALILIFIALTVFSVWRSNRARIEMEEAFGPLPSRFPTIPRD